MRKVVFKRKPGHKVDFLVEGEDYYKKFINLINEAQKEIHLQTYIFEMDEFGTEVHKALMQAAARGVQVYVIIDSMGSFTFTDKAADQLVHAGVHFCRFNGFRFKWLGQWGRRLHHKILLVDQGIAIIGGINVISSSYHKPEVEPQLDFAVQVEGPVTEQLTEYCQIIFKKACAIPNKFIPPVSWPQLPNSLKNIEVGISINDWVYRRWKITRQYSKLTKVAQHDILIVNSYFFPRRKFMKQLVKASKRGVKVRLLLPKFSDWPSYVYATQYLYSYFLKNGIEIYQWKKSILHGKLATIDNSWSTVGSFNLNYTSYQQNLEMNVDISSSEFTRALNEKIQKFMLEGCEKIEATDFIAKASLKTRFLRFFFYIILALVANFSIGLAFQEEEKHNRFYKAMLVLISIALFILGIIGAILPIMPGIPFFVMSFLLIYRQIIFNNKNV